MKLDDAMRAELLYRQEQFLEEAHLDPVGFGNRYGISTKNMQRVLDRKPIPKSVLENICSILGVPFSALRTPPDQEKGYQHFLQTVMELSLSPMTMEQRKERMKQEQQRMGASQSLWNRYSVWAEYEMELAKKLLSPTDSLEYAEYRKAQADMREAVAVKGNIDCLLGHTDERNKAQER